ncbi:TetR/AcrR family transcriptional regulator [Glaesserella parasuis]|nr:TetR/AcrR family transcriptional regulator [Glaesserella parasuis]MDE3945260.1 TetR/AcrR family transcriptional regulator [Glaesserella parasuis]MDE3947743.1 TetR/AcrR family transcriptional regulator [Glaesserella parasuis]
MFKGILPQNEVAMCILNATDRLMAKEGVQNLSTHKIAKEAGVSVGTIYLYFKDKETLLNQLVLYLFNTFHSAVDREYDPDLPLFEQYKKLWNADWVTWNKFVKQGQSQNIIANLPPFVLLAISMKTAWELMYQQLMLNQPYAQEMLEEVIIRTWKAITI